MKKILLILTCMISLSAGAQGRFSVKGTISGLAEGSRVTITAAENRTGKKIAEAPVRAGAFSMTGRLTRPTFCLLNIFIPSTSYTDRLIKTAEIRFLLEPAEVVINTDTAIIMADTLHYYYEEKSQIKGSKWQDEYNEYKNAMRPLEIAKDEADFSEADAWQRNGQRDEAIIRYRLTADRADSTLKQAKMEFMRRHPGYAVSAYIAEEYCFEFFSHTDGELTDVYSTIKNNTDTARVEFISKNLANFRKFARGVKYTDFKVNDADGKTLSISEMMKPNTATIIDFWASWDTPSKLLMPKLARLYDRLKNKVTIVCTAIDTDTTEWKKAQRMIRYPWAQTIISQTEFMRNAGQAYYVQTIPLLVVIDKDGRVMMTTHEAAEAAKCIESTICGR